MQQRSCGRIDEPILDDRRLLFAGHVHLKESVMPCGRAQNRAQLLGVYREGDGAALAAVQNRRNFAGLAKPPRFVLAPSGSGRAFYYNLFRLLCHGLLSFPTVSGWVQVPSP